MRTLLLNCIILLLLPSQINAAKAWQVINIREQGNNKLTLYGVITKAIPQKRNGVVIFKGRKLKVKNSLSFDDSNGKCGMQSDTQFYIDKHIDKKFEGQYVSITALITCHPKTGKYHLHEPITIKLKQRELELGCGTGKVESE